MKKLFTVAILLGFSIFGLTEASFSTEVVNIHFDDKLPAIYDDSQLFSFERGPKGELSAAYHQYVKEQKQLKELKDKSNFHGDLHLLSQTPIINLPGRSIWTYEIEGLHPKTSEQTIKLKFEKISPQLKLAVPYGCTLEGDVIADQFDPSFIKDLPGADSLCEKVLKADGITYFVKNIKAQSNTVRLSIVATSVPSSPSIHMVALIDGYAPIKSSNPGPDIGI